MPAVALAASTHVFPVELLVSLLNSLFRLLGGEPSQLEDPRLSLTTRLSIVRGQYETYGVPENLTAEERLELLETIAATNVLIHDPLIALFANDKAVSMFDASLHEMWHKLDGPGPLLP